ncbi:Plasmid stabilization system protein [Cylindrospermum stagnale PCC 7417]|uniref:Plasmid stabilization system protein n=1 Tax=Cylindrospermum stagnale PCC 7417 TaxID=56107 RepID=K9WW15_9NOST|nr:type II toxin-antitoxin system RelE/ParE family toxin [Cylindrospermum stagnale]AFZ23697.1 Plasmid stabilization system protein [Cylindrospermum stagnale PCC 7417]
MKPVIIHTEAIREFDNAIAYYEAQKVGLGLDLLSEVEQALGNIRQNPNLGTQHAIAGVRRYVLQRFPYLVFYVEFEEFIWIMAMARSARWKRSHMEDENQITGKNERLNDTITD